MLNKILLIAIISESLEEYPRRPAFVMLSKIIEDFEKEFPNWSKIDSAQFDLAKIMTRWQDPKTADSILKGK